MSREVPDAWRRFCSGSIFYTISRAVFTSMEWRCHLSNCKRFASKPSYQNGRQSMQRTFWLSSKTPIHRKFSPKYFHVQYLGDMSAKIPARNPWLAGLGDTFLISWTSMTSGDIPKIPISMLTVASGEYHSNICVFYVDLSHWLPPGDLFRLRPGLFRNL